MDFSRQDAGSPDLELRQPGDTRRVKSAVAEVPDADLHLGVLTVGEIAKGIGLLAAGWKKKALTSWLTGFETKFGDRILAIDIETARLWGELTARAQKSGIIIPGVDGLLAVFLTPAGSAAADDQTVKLRHALMPVGRGTLPARRGESGGRKVSDSRAHLLGGEAIDIEWRCLGLGRLRRAGRIGQQYAMRRAQIVAGCLDVVAGKPRIAGMDHHGDGCFRRHHIPALHLAAQPVAESSPVGLDHLAVDVRIDQR